VSSLPIVTGAGFALTVAYGERVSWSRNKAVKEKLFTPIFTTKSKGQGFGLAVVKRITEALGGKVAFESQEGKGTIFIIHLPSKS
jgi:nitrogen-specific signal transduction histidine kinase